MSLKKREKPHPFGKIVVAARERKGWTRYKLISASGHSAAQLYALEKGKCGPSVDTIIWVAEALEMPPAQLFQELYMALKKEKEEEAGLEFSPSRG